MKSTFTYRLHAGTASILLVFLTLCLISFAVLTRAGANADHTLSQKYAERTAAYYRAVSEAERFIADTDAVLKDLYEESADEASYTEKVAAHFGEEKITASFTVDERQILTVILSPDYENRYRIESYRLFTDEGDFLYDEEPLNLPH